MTAAQLSQNMQSAVLDQFGPDQSQEMFPFKYFNHNVKVIAPNGMMTPRAPAYCATLFGANELKSFFTADNPDAGGLVCTGIAFGNAVLYGGLLDSWNDTEAVPYLAFGPPVNVPDGRGGFVQTPSGPFVNAAQLLGYFNHGWSPLQAAAYAVAEVKGAK